MYSLGNLRGTIKLKDEPIATFEFKKNAWRGGKLLCTDIKKLPPEFRKKTVNEHTVRCFFDARITPDTRIHLNEDLRKSGMPYYNAEALIKHQKGRCFDDSYWVDIP